MRAERRKMESCLVMEGAREDKGISLAGVA